MWFYLPRDNTGIRNRPLMLSHYKHILCCADVRFPNPIGHTVPMVQLRVYTVFTKLRLFTLFYFTEFSFSHLQLCLLDVQRSTGLFPLLFEAHFRFSLVLLIPGITLICGRSIHMPETHVHKCTHLHGIPSQDPSFREANCFNFHKIQTCNVTCKVVPVLN
jgi:hypothetical protein